MNFKWAAMLLAICLVYESHATDFYSQPMQRLDDAAYGEQQTLTPFTGTPVLMSFFMPNCRWCEKQHVALTKLIESCAGVQPVMMGVNGNRRDLRRALKRKHNTFPAFLSSREFTQALGVTPPVPMTLIFNRQGELVFYTQGYRSQQTLSTLLKKHRVTRCL
ncbi:TlpA disulfide reductase family protein [Pseudoalteromonas sp. OOF1S-7]|uniref:TlpA family protein disulfide reductase n=1 Tax=Pseudoalteromonas sp. OOF1S-7 TaxID=2917757 RepID=UPI001EF46E8E|nr:TlpA disulfide reductase family protein [Pseudoalteromonas sp. OOF1S-7]MCG7536564.1 TlpA family protein disulfide reductase [Pseudoalteromonas sp. OOF1S-7]